MPPVLPSGLGGGPSMNLPGEWGNYVGARTWLRQRLPPGRYFRPYSDVVHSTPGLVSFYRGNERAGTPAFDEIGGADGAYTGTFTLGQTGLVPSEPDSTSFFDNGSPAGYISVPANSKHNLGNTWSIEISLKRNSTGSGYVLNKGTTAYGIGFDAGSKFYAEKVNTTLASTETGSTTDTAAHHFIASCSAGTVTIYKDGVDVTNVNNTPTFANTASPLEIGRESSSTSFSGNIGPTAIYSVALTAAQALEHYNAWLGSTGPVANLLTLTAALSFTGSMPRAITHGLTAGLSFAGATLRSTSHALSGALSFAGSLPRRAGKALTGGLSFTGSQGRAIAKTTTAGLSFTGTQQRAIAKTTTASLSFTGSLVRRTAKTLAAAALSFTGNLTAGLQFQKLMAATLSFAGSVTRVPGRVFTATLSFTGSQVRATTHGLAATLSFAGALPRRTAKGLTASLAFAGALPRTVGHPITASLSFAGAMTRRTTRGLTAALSFAGAIPRSTRKAFAAALSFAGSLASSGGSTPRGGAGPRILSAVSSIARALGISPAAQGSATAATPPAGGKSDTPKGSATSDTPSS